MSTPLLCAVLDRPLIALKAVLDTTPKGTDRQRDNQTALQGLVRLMSPVFHELASAQTGWAAASALDEGTAKSYSPFLCQIAGALGCFSHVQTRQLQSNVDGTGPSYDNLRGYTNDRDKNAC